MSVIHFVSHNFPPSPGGGEDWALRFVRFMKSAGHLVVVYIDSNPHGEAALKLARQYQFELQVYGENRKVWEEPLLASDWGDLSLASERTRLDFLYLRNAIEASRSAYPNHNHLIVSWFLIEHCYLASLLSIELRLPHLAVAVGTDISRGVRNARERAIAGLVCTTASHLVAMNREHAEALRRHFGAKHVSVVPISIESTAATWRRSGRKGVHIFSDCGYTHKKGTQVLLSSVCTLLRSGYDLRLTICGRTEFAQESYWNGLRSNYSALDGFLLYDHLAQCDVRKLLYSADIYCSATLGEGSSHARISALCYGIPIVTTATGEMPDIAPDHERVRLCPPADERAFTETLRQACLDLVAGKFDSPEPQLEAWRALFSTDRERSQYLEIVNSLSSAHA